jgi:hypothetical protein
MKAVTVRPKRFGIKLLPGMGCADSKNLDVPAKKSEVNITAENYQKLAQ